MTPPAGRGEEGTRGYWEPVSTARRRRTNRIARRTAVVVLGLLVLVALGAAVVWHVAGGGRWQVVATPSMGTAAPVGTLVLTEPADRVAVGDVVTYHPAVPNHPNSVTHRVVSVAPDGTFRTRGDINGAVDPWDVRPADLVGVASAILPGLGWLVRGAPILIVGTVLVWFVTRFLMPWRWGLPVRVLGLSLVVSAAITMLKPFVGLVVLGTTADAGGSHLTLVSTGVLPLRATAETGGHLDLVDGQVGVLTTQLPPGAKGAVVTTGVHMPVWLWVVMTLVWLVPMFYGLLAAWRRPLDDEPAADDPPDDDPTGFWGPTAAELDPPTDPDLIPWPAARPMWTSRARLSVLAVAVVAALGASITMTAASTTAAFTARVVNTANTAASAPFFTCASALASIAPAYLAWPLDEATPTNGSTARDVSGNTRTGQYTNGFTTSASAPCARDTQRSVTLAPTAALPSHVATSGLLSAVNSTNVFSLTIWIRTTTATGGKFMGWGNARQGASTVYDRHLYMANSGQVVFGVYPGTTRTVTSPQSYNDGQWHQVTATLSGAGMVLYVDGARVAADPTTTTAEGGLLNLGFWRVGYDNLGSWPNRPTTDYWTGSVADAAVYTSALSAAQVAALYGAAS